MQITDCPVQAGAGTSEELQGNLHTQVCPSYCITGNFSCVSVAFELSLNRVNSHLRGANSLSSDTTTRLINSCPFSCLV